LKEVKKDKIKMNQKEKMRRKVRKRKIKRELKQAFSSPQEKLRR